jgi:pimeloyl-ACP methyl ester carboxylesterase
MWVAAHHPELVRALILGDNVISVRNLHRPMVEHPIHRALFSGLRDLTRAGGSVEQIAEGIGKIVLPIAGTDEFATIGELPGNDTASLLSWARCVQQADPDAYDMTLDGSSIVGWDGEALLRGITCPTLLLQANPELGGLMSDADVALATRILPRHKHVKFRQLGHGLFIQQREPVLQAVAEFLEAL